MDFIIQLRSGLLDSSGKITRKHTSQTPVAVSSCYPRVLWKVIETLQPSAFPTQLAMSLTGANSSKCS